MPLPPRPDPDVLTETRRVRPVHLGPIGSTVRRGADGAVYLNAIQELGDYPDRITDCLDRWAGEAPDRTFLAERDDAGEWRRVSYAETLQQVRSIGQSLIDRRLSVERPILILSGNGIDHALVALAAMYVGVPYAPIAPAYSLQAQEFSALRQIFERMQPGLVFAADGARFVRALREVLPDRVELITTTSTPAEIGSTPLATLSGAQASQAVDAARDAVGPDAIAKVLFTSGSTGRPKGVINTQRMLCSNQEMIRAVLRFLGDRPPVLCDWLPWNHTAGGNHNFGLVLYNGGTLYIDDGKPAPALFAATLRNLRDIPCTAHFEVPRFYEMLMPHLRADAALRQTFFRDLQLLFYAAAGLGQRFWEELRELSLEACGEELLIMTGFGATETAPFALSTGIEGAFAGMVGFPAPGMELKLAAVGSKLEARSTAAWPRTSSSPPAPGSASVRCAPASSRRQRDWPRMSSSPATIADSLAHWSFRISPCAATSPALRPTPPRHPWWTTRPCGRGSRRRSTHSRGKAPAARRSSRARYCSTSRHRWTRAKSPTRDHSTRKPSCSSAPRWSRRSTRPSRPRAC